ncbi:MAG: beta-N-acetylhexosaminidase [Deltaproteobacteria bacterium]|nr:beta-N-acetylhexosaminidase [Deltaproteobacteria bacterium]
MSTDLALDRLCGQLIVGGYLGDRPTPTFLHAVEQGHRAGAILFKRNLPSIEAAHSACSAIAAAAPDGLPPWLCLDEEGGRVRRLPSPFVKLPAMLKLGAHGDEALIERCGRVAGAQLRALGFNLNLAPVLDVNTNPSNPVIGDRAFSADPLEAGRMALAYLRGLRAAGMVGCGKHFPGHGDTSVDSHVGLPVVAWRIDRLRQIELVPFQAAISAGIECLMSAHIVCESIDAQSPATLSPILATDLLRSELGFQGVLLSDDLEMKAISARRGFGEAAVAAIAAGCDAVLICSQEQAQEQAHAALIQEAERSPGFRTRCEQAASRSLALRRRFPAAASATPQSAMESMYTRDARELATDLSQFG